MEIKFLDNLTTLDNATAFNNPYKVTLQFGNTGDENRGIIQGWIADDSIEFSTGNTWTELYSVAGMGSIETLNNILVGITGYSLRTKTMLTKIWTGTATMEIKVGIIFQAENDAQDDVWKKIWKLFKYASPTETNVADRLVPGLSAGIVNFVDKGKDLFKSVPVMSQLANLASGITRAIFDNSLLGSPDKAYPLQSVHIGTMLHMHNVQIKNISISPSLSNIGYSTKKAISDLEFTNKDKRTISDSSPYQSEPTRGGGTTSFNNRNTSTFPNYARVDLQLQTNSIWTSDDIDTIISRGEIYKSGADTFSGFNTGSDVSNALKSKDAPVTQDKTKQ